jgi:hypothetical protein
MSELDTQTKQIDQYFEGIGAKNLEELRYAYRIVIYSGAMKILRDFPDIIVGPPPAPSSEKQQQQQQQREPGQGGGGGGVRPPPVYSDSTKPPYRPSAILRLACIALGNCPEPTEPDGLG